MNKSDSERMAAFLEKIGYKMALKENEANLILVNMCSVRQAAVDKIFGLMNNFQKLKKKNKNFKTILTGCVVKSDRKSFKKGFDFILDIKNLKNWQNILGKNPVFSGKKEDGKDDYLNILPKYETDFRAFIPISSGCNNFCTYCVVPYTRGTLYCRDHKEILKEVKNIIKKGYKEIWLLGQNVNNYYSPTKQSVNFAKLLKMINNIPGNFWIRFTSPHPKDFSDELIKNMAKCKKMTPYLNLPVQSGNNEVLKRMNRPYNIEKYKSLVKKIRNAFKKYRSGLEKEVAISTDIIVGFPGETKKQFENTAKLFKQMKFDMAYIAKYSPRPGTPAAKMQNNVSPKEKERRWKFLNKILKEIALMNNKKCIGKEVEVLLEESKNNYLVGKSRHYKTVKILMPDTEYKIQNTNWVGKIIKAKIINAHSFGLEGKLV